MYMYNDYNLSYIFGFFFYTRIMVISVTFNNISVISWWSVLLVNETAGADPEGGGGTHPKVKKKYDFFGVKS